MGISDTFVGWVILIFNNARALVNLNGRLGEEYKIQRGVRQSFPLAPYLFLIVGEALTYIIKKNSSYM